VRLVGDGYEVDVVLHQAVSQDAHAGLGSIGGEAFEVSAAVGAGEENALPINAALGDVVRHSYGDGASESGHMLIEVASSEDFSLRTMSLRPRSSPKFPEVPNPFHNL
jgi:hypothetical protein